MLISTDYSCRASAKELANISQLLEIGTQPWVFPTNLRRSAYMITPKSAKGSSKCEFTGWTTKDILKYAFKSGK